MPNLLRTMHKSIYYSSPPSVPSSSDLADTSFRLVRRGGSTLPIAAMSCSDQSLPKPLGSMEMTDLIFRRSDTTDQDLASFPDSHLVRRGGDGSAGPAIVITLIAFAAIAACGALIWWAKRSHAKAYAKQRSIGRVGGWDRRRPARRHHDAWHGAHDGGQPHDVRSTRSARSARSGRSRAQAPQPEYGPQQEYGDPYGAVPDGHAQMPRTYQPESQPEYQYQPEHYPQES